MRLSLWLVLAASISATPAVMTEMKSHQARTVSEGRSCAKNITGDPNHRKYWDKAERALRDARRLAGIVLYDVNDFLSSTAYTNYFAYNEQKEVIEVYRSIYQTYLGEDNHIWILCGNDAAPGSGCAQTTAVTVGDSDADQMTLCDDFFDDFSAEALFFVRKNLPSLRYNNVEDGWCQPGKQYNYFVVAGSIILQQTARLNTVGRGAGMSKRPVDFNSGDRTGHGASDIYNYGEPIDISRFEAMAPWQAARKLETLWYKYWVRKSQYKPRLATFENAGSIAAAATEYWFLTQCGWQYILPDTDVYDDPDSRRGFD